MVKCEKADKSRKPSLYALKGMRHELSGFFR
jgi:hypothetical protein